MVEQRTENPRVGGSIPPLATTPNFLKRNGFPASPADYRRPRGRKSADHRTIGNRVGRAGPRRGAGGDLANWKPGTGIRAARRGAGRRGPAVARSARVGRTRAAAMASPMARRRASRGRRDATSEEAHAGARESVHRIGLARSLRNACNRRNTRARRGGRRRIEYAREPTHTVLLSDHYCMRYPVDAHRLHAVASRGEHAARTARGHGQSRTSRHCLLASTERSTGSRTRTGCRCSHWATGATRRPCCATAPMIMSTCAACSVSFARRSWSKSGKIRRIGCVARSQSAGRRTAPKDEARAPARRTRRRSMLRRLCLAAATTCGEYHESETEQA